MTDSTPSTADLLADVPMELVMRVRAQLMEEMGAVITDQFNLGAMAGLDSLRSALRKMRDEAVGSEFERGLHLAVQAADQAHEIVEVQRRDAST